MGQSLKGEKPHTDTKTLQSCDRSSIHIAASWRHLAQPPYIRQLKARKAVIPPTWAVSSAWKSFMQAGC